MGICLRLRVGKIQSYCKTQPGKRVLRKMLHPTRLQVTFSLLVVQCAITADAFLPFSPQVDTLSVPAGFNISAYYEGRLPDARSMVLGGQTQNGGTIVYVSTRQRSEVYALIDDDLDGIAENMTIVINDQESPFGLAYYNGSLWVAQKDTRIVRYDNVDLMAESGIKFEEPIVIRDDLPTNKDPIQFRPHYWRYISFGPDGKLYVSIGAPLDLRVIPPSINPLFPYGSIVRMDLDGSNVETVATGIRNNVGLEFHPVNKWMYYSNNEADQLGPDYPDDTLHYVDIMEGDLPQDGGFPYCHALGEGPAEVRTPGRPEILADEEFNKDEAIFSCQDFNFPIQALGPHAAPLGLRFKSGEMFPEEYDNALFIARHGSNDAFRSDVIGYDVAVLFLDESGTEVLDHKIFATGFLQTFPKGRPADVLFLPDGSMLVSDDGSAAVYRITYVNE
eukprot:TRINITY_DN28483_c0_g1_i1.p1 TRINITY_DN28483_c0_g1~~TRINITY_DN28483_c0_g1_i1.p1  ORF type:complete len:447 (-),score=29.88 TRINITY_DN28483_c0_g1_i1:190-1530(-)